MFYGFYFFFFFSKSSVLTKFTLRFERLARASCDLLLNQSIVYFYDLIFRKGEIGVTVKKIEEDGIEE